MKVHVTTAASSLHEVKTVVAVDVFRSSSTIITALSNGAKSVTPFTNLSKAIRAHRGARQDTILAGERKGITPTHFDYNISPFEMSRDHVSGKTVLYSSSNLTRILGKLGKQHRVILGAIVNASAVANYLQARHENVAIVPCGTKLGTAVEDMVGAGAIAASIKYAAFSDDALAVIGLFRSKGWKGLVKRGRVAHRLVELGFVRDIEFCLRLNSSSLVPSLAGKEIVDVKRSRRS